MTSKPINSLVRLLAALCLWAFGTQAAQSQWHPDPAKMPWLPKIEINNLPGLCNALYWQARISFVNTGLPKFALSEPKLHWEKVNLDTYPNLRYLAGLAFAEIQSAYGRKEILLRYSTTQHNVDFLGGLVVSNRVDLDKTLVQLNRPSKGAPVVAGMPVFDRAYADKDNNFGTFFTFELIRYLGIDYVFAPSGQTVTVFQVSGREQPQPICRLRLWPEPSRQIFPGKYERLNELVDLLRTIAGGDLQYPHFYLRRRDRYFAIAALAPWALADEKVDIVSANPESLTSDQQFSRTLRFMEGWSIEGIWNFDKYAQYRSRWQDALNQLASYYVSNFGVAPRMAMLQAEIVLKIMTMRTLDFRSYDGRYNFDYRIEFLLINQSPPEYAALVRDLLEGLPISKFEPKYSGVIWSDLAPGVAGKNWRFEPILFFALNHIYLVDWLLKTGVSVDSRNWFGKTPLMMSAHLDKVESARVLLRGGADVNAATSEEFGDQDRMLQIRRRSALMYAAENAGLPMIELLLEHGANKNARNSQDKRAIDLLPLNKKLSPADRAKAEALLK